MYNRFFLTLNHNWLVLDACHSSIEYFGWQPTKKINVPSSLGELLATAQKSLSIVHDSLAIKTV